MPSINVNKSQQNVTRCVLSTIRTLEKDRLCHGEGIPEGAKYISSGIKVRKQWRYSGLTWLRLVDREEQKERGHERRFWRHVQAVSLGPTGEGF